MKYKIPIPDCYIWMTEGYENRGRLFKKYVHYYIKKSYPEIELVKIQGMTAICERKEGLH